MDIDPTDLPYPPTHPRGQHRMWTDEEIAAVQATDQRRDQVGDDPGFNSMKQAYMNRVYRRERLRAAQRRR